MIEVTGVETKTKYFLVDEKISGFHKHRDQGSVIFTDRIEKGSTVGYHVSETVEEILLLLEMGSEK